MSLLPLSLVLLAAGAGLAPPLAPLLRSRLPLLLGALPAGLAVAFAFAGDGGWSLAWAPSLGVELHLRLDGLSRLFAVLSCAIGALVLGYSGAYLRGHPRLPGFCALLLAFLAAMLGLVLADDVVGLFVFWEATSLTSFLLIGFEHERRAARRGAVQALVVTAAGGLALLAGLLLAAQEAGTMRLSALVAAGELLRASPAYGAVLGLVLVGAFTKSAQVPVHFWLPSAMAAPTPVSALLHSSTMVKAGVYLLARLHPGLGGTVPWTLLLTAFGGVTLVVGATLALRERDSKGMLACTTVASLGLLVLLLGVGTDAALKAALLYLVAHAAFKGSLFLVAGGIDRCGGGRDVTRVAGLGRPAPGLAIAGGVAALSMAGLPPATGFLAKEVLYEALTAPGAATAWLVAAVLGNALMVAAAVQVGVLPFFGAPKAPAAPRAERDAGGAELWGPPALLAGAGLLAPFAPGLLAGPLAAAASTVRGSATAVELHLVPSPGPALAASAGTLALGVASALLRGRLRAGLTQLFERTPARRLRADPAYDACLRGATTLARRGVRFVQSGFLKRYLFALLAVTTGAASAPLWLEPGTGARVLEGLRAGARSGPFVLGTAAFVLAGALAVVLPYRRIVAIVAMGSLGLGMALLFLAFSAPDVAFTQLMVEILSVVIITLVVTRLPVRGIDRRSTGVRLRDGVLALAAGLAFAVQLLAVLGRPPDGAMRRYFLEQAPEAAHGLNVVNVILVDFRALDTLGESVVVVCAAVAILGLLEGAREP